MPELTPTGPFVAVATFCERVLREADNVLNISATGPEVSGFAVDREGLWWFDVLFGDAETLLARIPLKVNYHPQRTPG